VGRNRSLWWRTSYAPLEADGRDRRTAIRAHDVGQPQGDRDKGRYGHKLQSPRRPTECQVIAVALFSTSTLITPTLPACEGTPEAPIEVCPQSFAADF
jgi:hypothetical protein